MLQDIAKPCWPRNMITSCKVIGNNSVQPIFQSFGFLVCECLTRQIMSTDTIPEEIVGYSGSLGNDDKLSSTNFRKRKIYQAMGGPSSVNKKTCAYMLEVYGFKVAFD